MFDLTPLLMAIARAASTVGGQTTKSQSIDLSKRAGRGRYLLYFLCFLGEFQVEFLAKPTSQMGEAQLTTKLKLVTLK
jgi:hypothetical protein